MNEDENGFVGGEEMKRQVLCKVLYSEQVFCSIFENRKNTGVSGIGNISTGDIPKNYVVTNRKSVIFTFISYGYISASF